jgi:hypothetical protein
MPRYKDRTEAAMRRAYIGQRCRAKSRGIAFLFTFEQWRAWWLIDDRWGRRGRRADQLMMARCGNAGPYSPDNVFCTTPKGNSHEALASLQTLR